MTIQYNSTQYSSNPIVMPNRISYQDLELDYVIYTGYYRREMNEDDVLKQPHLLSSASF